MKKVPVAGTTFYENKGAPRRRVGKNRIIDAVFCSPLRVVALEQQISAAFSDGDEFP